MSTKKSKKWLWGIAVFVVVVVIFVVVKKSSPEAVEYSSIIAERGTLLQTVSETGSVVAGNEITYGWQIGGRVVRVDKQVGDSVMKGDVIAQVESTEQEAAFREGQAALAASRARLNVEVAGATNEQIRESLAKVNQQKASVRQSEADLTKTRVSAQKSIDAAQQALDSAENDLQSIDSAFESQLVQDANDDLRLVLSATKSKLNRAMIEADNILGVDNPVVNDAFESDLAVRSVSLMSLSDTSYKQSRLSITSFSDTLDLLSSVSSEEEIALAADEGLEVVNKVQATLAVVRDVLDATFATVNIPEATLDTYKTDIAAQLTTLDTQEATLTDAIQAVSTAKNSLRSADIAYGKAISDLANTKIQADADIVVAEAQLETQRARLAQVQAAHDGLIAPSRDVDLAALRAEVLRSSASLERVRAELDKTQLLALADGILATIDIEVGENVTASQEVATIISKELVIDVDISESDIAKVAKGDTVEITLDAFTDDEIFKGEIKSIDPAETEISGVIYYRTKIKFLLPEQGREVRSGMTANITVFTERKEGVVYLPQRAILQDGDVSYVRVLMNKKTGEFERRDVTVGLRGDDGFTEMKTGVEEGEEIITFVKSTP